MPQYSWDRKKVFFFTVKIANAFFKARKVLINLVNESATSAPCCHSYIKLLYLLPQISTIKIPKVFFFWKTGYLAKSRKIKSLLIEHALPQFERNGIQLGLENHFIFNFYLNNHQKSQSLKTGKKIICKFIIDTKSKLFLPK